MANTKTNGNGKGNEVEYESLLKELDEKGIAVDAKEIMKDGLNPLQMPRTNVTNAQILISIPEIDRLFKDNPSKAYIYDLSSRTVFKSYDQKITFDNWVDWCDNFTGEYEGCILYLCGLPSIGGQSREEYAEAINIYHQLRKNGSSNKQQFKPNQQLESGKLS